MAEFSAVIRKDVAWRVLAKATLAIFGGLLTVFSVAIVPVLWVYGSVEGNRKDNARLDETVKGLATTVGGLQLTVAGIGAEVKNMKSETIRGIERIEKLLDPPVPRPAPRPRQSATAPATRTQ